jgi:drug/metabolite transporter (DMT)-like permease
MAVEETIGVLLALTAATAWGSAAVLSKTVLKIDHSLAIVMVIRGLFAVPFIGLLAIFTIGIDSILRFLQPDLIWLMLLSSIFVGMGDYSFFGALQRVEVSKAQPVTAVYPLFTAIILIVFGVEVITGLILVGTFLIVFGVAFISNQNSSTRKQKDSIQTLGLILAIAAALFWSFAILTIRVILDFPGVQVLGLATVRFSMMAVMMAGLWVVQSLILPRLSLHNENHSLEMSKKEVIVLGLGGLITWGIGGVAFFYSIDMIGAARATPISSINPLIAVLLIIFLRERLSRTHALGILLVSVGVIFISLI